MLIKEVRAREILDSRGLPTVSVTLTTNNGYFHASVPSGTSTGKYEAVELREKNGSVKKAVKNIQKIITPKIINKNFDGQLEIDNVLLKLDGTKNKSTLGANAMLALSIACCRAFAAEKKISLYYYIKKKSENKKKFFIPKPLILIFEGGKHIKENMKNKEIQEFMIIPQEKKFSDNFNIGKKAYEYVGELLKKNNLRRNIGLEGAYFSIGNNKSLYYIDNALKKLKIKCSIALDVAASELLEGAYYILNGKKLTKEMLFNTYLKLIKKYPIASIEDCFDQDDWKIWRDMTEKIGKEIMIVGDDFLASNPKRITQAINEKAANSLLLKINQIGTITEAIESANRAHNAGWNIIVSHRSGETNDDFIADFAVGVGAQYVKFGAPVKIERAAKYNRLLHIGEELKL